METTPKINKYLLPEWWEIKLARLNPTESSLDWKMPFSIRHGYRGNYVWYEKNGFILGYTQEKARKRPKFIISYKPEENEYWIEWEFDFKRADLFMDFLDAMVDPTLLPICLPFVPCQRIIEICLSDLDPVQV